ncbi:Pectin lyase-like protein [Mycena indigotica]|uniref:Pectin lyase-like protein n=1 Tax=Mycena indigotica TaxID=2126181 RepID=A0A8H6T409_9AGAR|nr:Pectin lyase-like protein [Mycena indigotica]KAF7309507.1 Pectin lyase-like protein [Mycena indigotica]
MMRRRLLSTAALDHWISVPKQVTLRDTFSLEKLSDLYITLPTRDGSRGNAYAPPTLSSSLGSGAHLAFFHPRNPETALRPDGTDAEFCPPGFERRMWAGGRMSWNVQKPLLAGASATSVSTIGAVEKKGFDKGSPMVFVKQKIEITMDGHESPSVVEERSHVYLPGPLPPTKSPRKVEDLPSKADFSFTFTPTLSTLFRFSALTFNGHHIHLDKDYARSEGYPERLVHGPLTALMLLETTMMHTANASIANFEYRARNPIIVNRPMTICGAWTSGQKSVILWAVDGEGVVGMTGKSTSKSLPTLFCPPETIYVSLTDKKAQFTSVQAAVQSLPQDETPRFILIGAGEYLEAVNVTRTGQTILLGQSDHTQSYAHNLVTIFNTTFINQTTQISSLQDNADSAVLTVAPNKYAAWTGQGYYGGTPVSIPNEFGCKDFRAYNINFENRANNGGVGPALALGIGFSNASFYASTFRGMQDTMFIGKNASAVFRKSQVLGSVDYIYGFGTAYFDESLMGTRGAGCVTAWKGTPNYTNTYGAYFSRSAVVRSPDANANLNLTGKQTLGRPWNNASVVVYMDSFMDETINPAGFQIWSPTDPRNETIYYAEQGSHGPGFNASTRVSFDHLLTAQEARQKFSVEKIFGGKPGWVDWEF